MRFLLGPPPNSLDDSELASGHWHRLIQLPIWAMHVIALLVGALFACVLLIAWAALTPQSKMGYAPTSQIIIVSITVLALGILVRIASHPRFGISPKSLVGFWPSRLALFTAYMGKTSKQRFLLQFFLPFLLLSVVPMAAVFAFKISSGWPVFVSCLTASIFGMDVFLAMSIALLLPAHSVMAGRGLHIYWRAGDAENREGQGRQPAPD